MWEAITALSSAVVAVIGLVGLWRAHVSSKYRNAARVAVQRLISSQTDIARARKSVADDQSYGPEELDRELNSFMNETHRALALVASYDTKLETEIRGRLTEEQGK